MAQPVSSSSTHFEYITKVVEPLVHSISFALIVERPKDPHRFLLSWLQQRLGSGSPSSHCESPNIIQASCQNVRSSSSRTSAPRIEKRLSVHSLNWDQLFEVAALDDVDKLSRILDQRGAEALLQIRSEIHGSLLHTALKNGASQVTRWILSEVECWRNRQTYEHNLQGELLKRTLSSAVSCRDADGKSPLAALCSSTSASVEVTVALLEALADPSEHDYAGVTPFLECARVGHVEIGKLLIEATGQQVLSDRDDTCRTALHWAADEGHIGFVELMLVCGMNAEVSDCEGQTPCDLALRRGHVEIAKLFEPRELFEETEDVDGVMVDSLESPGMCRMDSDDVEEGLFKMMPEGDIPDSPIHGGSFEAFLHG